MSGYTLTEGQSTPVLISKLDFSSLKSITYSGTFANIVGGHKRVVWQLGREGRLSQMKRDIETDGRPPWWDKNVG